MSCPWRSLFLTILWTKVLHSNSISTPCLILFPSKYLQVFEVILKFFVCVCMLWSVFPTRIHALGNLDNCLVHPVSPVPVRMSGTQSVLANIYWMKRFTLGQSLWEALGIQSWTTHGLWLDESPMWNWKFLVTSGSDIAGTPLEDDSSAIAERLLAQVTTNCCNTQWPPNQWHSPIKILFLSLRFNVGRQLFAKWWLRNLGSSILWSHFQHQYVVAVKLLWEDTKRLQVGGFYGATQELVCVRSVYISLVRTQSYGPN